jgi:hypothetical protein
MLVATKKPETRSSAERILDRAIELTFPASDPISVEHAFRSARKRDQASPSQNQAGRQARRAKPKRRKAARR